MVVKVIYYKINILVDNVRKKLSSHLAMLPNSVVSDSRFQNNSKNSYYIRRAKGTGHGIAKISNSK